MNLLRECSEQQMVAAFLQGEIGSPRYRDAILGRLAADARRRSVVDAPDFSSAADNEYRRQLLAYRGYPDRTHYFEGFAFDWQWRLAELAPADLGRARYANFPAWSGLSGGSRLVAQGARNVAAGNAGVGAELLQAIEATRGRLERGETLPPVILIGAAPQALVVLEGHVRMTACALAARPLPAIVGTSPRAAAWFAW